MILPKIPASRIEKGKFIGVLEKLVGSKFTGFAKVAYRKEELSVAEVLFDGGKIIAAEVTKVKSKRSVAGDDAMLEIEALDNVVVEIYYLNSEDVRKIFEMNRNLEVKERKLPISPPKESKAEIEVKAVKAPEISRESILEKYNVSPPTESEIESIIENALGNSELYLDFERQKIMERYGIRKPSNEEVDQIIANALDLGEPAEEVEKDFETVKSEIIKLLETKLGKPAKKAIDIVSSCKSMWELSQNAGEIRNTLKALVVFIPRKKVDEVITEIEQKIGSRLG